MPEGFSLELQDYCSNCGDFEPDIEKIEMTCFDDKSVRYLTYIRCKNAYKCARIKENLERRQTYDRGI